MLKEVKASTTMAAIQSEIYKFFQAQYNNKTLQQVQIRYYELCMNDERLMEIDKHRQKEQSVEGLQSINIGLYTNGISEPYFSEYKLNERRETREPYCSNDQNTLTVERINSAPEDDDQESFKPATKRRKTETMDYRLTKPFNFGKNKVSRTEVKNLLIDNSKIMPSLGNILHSISENNEIPVIEQQQPQNQQIVLSESSTSIFKPIEREEEKHEISQEYTSNLGQKNSFISKNVIQSSSEEVEKHSELGESIEAQSPSMQYALSPSLDALREFASEDHYCIGLTSPQPAQQSNRALEIDLTPSKNKRSTSSSQFEFVPPPKENILESTGTSQVGGAVAEKAGPTLSSWELQSKIVQKVMLQDQKREVFPRSFGKPMENIPLLLQKRTYLERQF